MHCRSRSVTPRHSVVTRFGMVALSCRFAVDAWAQPTPCIPCADSQSRCPTHSAPHRRFEEGRDLSRSSAVLLESGTHQPVEWYEASSARRPPGTRAPRSCRGEWIERDVGFETIDRVHRP